MTAGAVIAGIGCRRGASSADIVTVVRHALAAAPERDLHLAALAAPAFKENEGGLSEAAAHLGITLILVDAASLEAAQPRCVTQSAHAKEVHGLASIAEGAALAAAGPDGILLLPRIAAGGVTCALARRPS